MIWMNRYRMVHLTRYDSYAEMVAEMDRSVGRLVAALEALKLREKTLIIFIADNGTPQQMIVRAEEKKLIKEPVISVQHGRKVRGWESNAHGRRDTSAHDCQLVWEDCTGSGS